MEVLFHIRPYLAGIFPYIGLIYMVGTSNSGFLKWPLITVGCPKFDLFWPIPRTLRSAGLSHCAGQETGSRVFAKRAELVHWWIFLGYNPLSFIILSLFTKMIIKWGCITLLVHWGCNWYNPVIHYFNRWIYQLHPVPWRSSKQVVPRTP